MTADLVERIRRALDGVPHDADCASVEGVAGEYHLILGACSCSRLQRQAERVGDAMMTMWFNGGRVSLDNAWAAALRVLEGER